MNIKQYLADRAIEYELIAHPEAFDAQHLAESLHLSGHEVAKAVLLRADHDYRFFVVVLPASQRVDLAAVSTFLGGADLEMASEAEIAERCPDCVRGILPVFGSHCGAQTIVDALLAEHETIAFASDCHTEAVRMKYADFYRLEHPLVARICEPAVH